MVAPIFKGIFFPSKAPPLPYFPSGHSMSLLYYIKISIAIIIHAFGEVQGQYR